MGRHAGTSPYGLLGVAEGQAARNGPERLNCIAGMARRLMDEHGLTGWTLAFVESRSRLGDCDFSDRQIRIGRGHALESNEEEIRDTVLHEIAHAIAGLDAGPWAAVEGDGAANRSHAAGEDVR